MATNDQKNPSKLWMETLTPIILALIGIVVPLTTVLLDKCGKSNHSPNKADSQEITYSSKPENDADNTTAQNRTTSKSPSPSQTSKETGNMFNGRVTGISGTSGLPGAEIIYGTTIRYSNQDGSFTIEIPKNVSEFILTVRKREFQSSINKYNIKESGKSVIRLRPE